MAEFVYDCPHCKTKSVGFDCQGSILAREEVLSSAIWVTFFLCRVCKNGIVVNFEDRTLKGKNPMDFSGDPRTGGFKVINVHPKPEALSAPKHVPDAIADYYVEALENLHCENFTSAGIMFRKVLDVSVKDLGASSRRLSLRKRVERLLKAGKLTTDLCDLADVIREGGNDATHEDPPYDKESANRLHEFTYLFLLYVYNLPGLVLEEKDRRAKLQTP